MADDLTIHPGARAVLDKLRTDELGVAKAIAAGELASPQRFLNIWLFAIRVTGTGASYRPSLDEFVWRDKKHYLNEWFLQRAGAGVPVVFSHPEANALDTGEYRARVVGSTMFAYVAGDEVWAVARINDADAARLMEKRQLSTSPAVVFRPADGNQTHGLADGSTLLVEGKPSLLDHIAVCEEGVWDKGGDATGVAMSTTGDNHVADKKDDDARKDEADAGQKLDKLLTAMDNLGSRMDAYDKRLDEFPPPKEEKENEARDDGGMPEELKAKLDDDAHRRADEGDDEGEPEELKSMPEETAADKTRKDAVRAHWKGRKDTYKARKDARAKADAALKAKADAEGEKDKELPADLKEKLDDDAKKRADEGEDAKPPAELVKRAGDGRADAAGAFWKGRHDSYRAVRKDATRPLADRLASIERAMKSDGADRDQLLAAQARADSVFQMHGKQAPRAMSGEGVIEYRKRLAKEMQPHSAPWKGIHLGTLGEDAFAIAEGQIYADSVEAAKRPVGDADGGLREVIKSDDTGRRIREFYGRPSAWMNQFSTNRRAVAGWKN